MIDLTAIFMIAVLPLLLVASGFVSGSETALFSLSDHQRLAFARSGSMAGNAITRLLAETRGLLITLMLSNMVVNVLYFVITTVLMIRLERERDAGPILLGAISVLVLVMLILVGEVLPKLVASKANATWSRLASLPLLVIHQTFGPARIILNALIITPLARLIAPRERPPELSPEELETLLTLSQQRGVIDASEEQLLQQVLALSQIKVRHLMTPRVDIVAHDLNDPPGKLIDLIRETRLSQIPVHRGNLDQIEGVVYARQVLLRHPGTDEDMSILVRQVRYVPEQQRADSLLLDMRKKGTRFAVVVDEYGGTAGLVTLEDVVEHMLGDITGPYAAAQAPQVQQTEPGRWRVSADLSVEDWIEAFGHTGKAPPVTTIGGLVMARLGRLPKAGDRVTAGDVLIEVEKMEGRRIDTLLLRVGTEQPKPTPAKSTEARS